RCSFRGTALTASSRPTGAGPRHTWTIMFVAEYRCGAGLGLTPSSGQCAASVMTSHPVDGPNATATSSTSRRQSLAFACSSPELAAHPPHAEWLPLPAAIDVLDLESGLFHASANERRLA